MVCGAGQGREGLFTCTSEIDCRIFDVIYPLFFPKKKQSPFSHYEDRSGDESLFFLINGHLDEIKFVNELIVFFLYLSKQSTDKSKVLRY